jgi:hypothetical protein
LRIAAHQLVMMDAGCMSLSEWVLPGQCNLDRVNDRNHPISDNSELTSP